LNDFLKTGRSIAFIGSVGLPNCYGGFESFVENIAPQFSENGDKVSVTCDYSKYSNKSEYYKGVKRIFLKVAANGWKSPIHDLLAFLSVFLTHKNIVVLGVSAGPFFLVMRLISFVFRRNLVVNIDGVEWRRDKFSSKVKLLLRIFDFLAQFSANKIVYDNEFLLDYVYAPFKKKATCIAYSGDHVKRFDKANVDCYALTVCRIEPENNIETLIKGVLGSNIKGYTIVGNWNNSSYGVNLKNKYAGNNKLKILDPIYDERLLGGLRENCNVYLHGHSVGGTNPSLVEMLYYDCAIICFDCNFNRSTADDDAQYFSTIDELSCSIDKTIDCSDSLKKVSRKKYTAKKIASEYSSLFS
jgi:glycosyltransferase involved in cell wall biosynthesis